MPYYADFSEHKESRTKLHPQTLLNVGWLEPPHLPVGETPQAFRDRLFEFCLIPIRQMRGFQVCRFCANPKTNWESHGNREAFLGSAEIRVIGEGKIYAAPNLIYHYVNTHNYLPPAEFIEAVFKSPLPGSLEFCRHFDQEWLQNNLPLEVYREYRRQVREAKQVG